MYMKKAYFTMPFLVPSPQQSENNIDVYLQPLVDELKDFWVDNLETYYTLRDQTFLMHAALLWRNMRNNSHYK